MKVKLAAALLAMIVAIPSVAAQDGDRVIQIWSYTGHTGLLVKTSGEMQNPSACANPTWYIFPDDSPRAAFVQSAFLSAMHTGKTVSLYLDGCFENYPKILHARFNAL